MRVETHERTALLLPLLLCWLLTGVAQDEGAPPASGGPASTGPEARMPAAAGGGNAAGDAPAAAALTEAADRVEASLLFRGYVENQDYPEALDAAAQALELSEAVFEPDDVRLVPVLNDMGEALLLNQRPAEARDYFARSAALTENSHGIFNAALFQPLYGLGRSEQALGRHAEATQFFQRAQHVTHRTEGVYNLTQVPAMSALVESLMAEQRWTEAENVQLAIYKVHRSAFGDGSLAALPSMYELARWYHDIMDYRQARLIYRDAIEVIEREEGEDSLRLVEPLRGMAATWGEERSSSFGKGLDAHERIVELVENSDDVDSRTRIIAHLELGDWYVQFNREQDAWAEYRRAWELARAVEDDEADVWLAYFDKPHLIHPGATLSVDFLGYGRVGDEVYYDFEFDIARDGRPEGIDVIGTNLHGQTRAAAIQAFRYARFRPRIVDGATVATTGYKVRRIYPTPPPDDYGAVGMGRSSTAGPVGGR